MITLYGIPNCDTVKKARSWLAERGVDHAFHDYKKEGVPEARLRAWVSARGWEALLNRRGTTFRALPPGEREPLDEGRAIAIMLAHPSTIKRPVLEGDRALMVGFDPDAWERALG